MKDVTEKNNWYARLFVGPLLLIGFSMTCFYIFFTYRTVFNSDAAGINLMAQDMISGLKFNPGFHGHYIIAPLLLFMKNGYFVHALSAFILLLFYVFALRSYLRFLGYTSQGIYLVMIVILAGFSPVGADSLFGHYAYGSQSIIMILWLLFSGYMLQDEDRGRWVALALMVVSIFVALMTFRGIANYYGPMAMAVACFSWWERPRVPKRRLARWLGTIVVGSLVGLVWGYLLMGQETMRPTVSTALAPVDHIAHTAVLIVKAYFFLLGASVYEAPSFYEYFLRAPVQTSLAVVLLVATLLPFLLLLFYRRIAPRPVRFLLLYHVWLVVCVLVVSLVGQVFVDILSSRYLLHLVVTAAIILGYGVSRLSMRSALAGTVAAVLLGVGVLYSAQYYLVRDYGNVVWKGNRPTIVPRTNISVPESLAGFLVEKGIKFGYAPFWVASATTIFSDSRVTLLETEFHDGLPMVGSVNTSRSIRAFRRYEGPSALVLRGDEKKNINPDRMSELLGEPDVVYSLGEFTILTYGFNIAKRLPGWNVDELQMMQKLAPMPKPASIAASVSEIEVEHGQHLSFTVTVTNLLPRPLTSYGPYPVNLGIQLERQDTGARQVDYIRCGLVSIHPHESRAYGIGFNAPDKPGEYRLLLALVQEGASWFMDYGHAPAVIRLTVR